MANKTDEIRLKIADVFDEIECLQERIADAPSFEAAQELQIQLQNCKLDLGRLQRELRLAEKSALELATQAPKPEVPKLF